jgi:ectoine hydroxylase
MQLSSAQIEQFGRDGYLFFHSLFSGEELAVLRFAMREILSSSRPSTYTEGSEDSIRMLKGMHLYNDTVLRLSRHPSLVRPCEQLLGSGVYVHQTRMVLKEGLKGSAYSGFPWHQDYSTFIRTDGMPEPRAIIIAVFLDDVTACNAPLMMIPGSHRHGLIINRSSAPDPNPHVQLVIEADIIREMAEQAGVVAHLGPAGSVVMMDVAMVHGSTENISPMSRTFYYLIYNSVENKCIERLRDEYHACNDFDAITPLPDDCLVMPSSNAQS